MLREEEFMTLLESCSDSLEYIQDNLDAYKEKKRKEKFESDQKERDLNFVETGRRETNKEREYRIHHENLHREDMRLRLQILTRNYGRRLQGLEEKITRLERRLVSSR